MNKPLTVAKEELEKQLVDLINSYQYEIPAFVTRDILKRIDAALESVERQQLESDRDFYNKSLEEGDKEE